MKAIVRIVNFPTDKVRGVVAFDDNGDANVYINASLSQNEQRKVLMHELDHIKNDDAYNDMSICIVESPF